MRRAGAVMTVLSGLLLAGCGQAEGDGASTPLDVTSSPAPASELKITTRASNDVAPRTWTLTCDPPGGDHPDAAAACAAIAKADKPFAPPAKDAFCTQIFGGPQTATITGTWKNEQVNASYNRTGGCEIARWDALAPVFQTNTGVSPS